MTCGACGEKPTHTTKDFTKAVIEIDNPEQIALLRKVSIPASMGDETNVPPAIGKYRNVILHYEANKHTYLYSSDGIPTLLEVEVSPEIIARVEALENDTDVLGHEVDGIEAKIPNAASAQNQLADKNFVNSSIATNTANYISNNGEPFTSVAQLEAYSGTVSNNDYAFVTGTDTAGNTYYDRYKATVSGEPPVTTWAKEYRLNNSSFTSDQWAAINSGITTNGVEKLSGLANIKTIGANLTLDADGELSGTGGPSGIPTSAKFWGASYDSINDKVDGAIESVADGPQGSDYDIIDFKPDNGLYGFGVAVTNYQYQNSGSISLSLLGRGTTSLPWSIEKTISFNETALSVGGLRIGGLSSPVNAQDAATKDYIDTAVSAIGAGTRRATSSGWNTSAPLEYIKGSASYLQEGQTRLIAGELFPTANNLSDFPVYAGIGIYAPESGAEYTPYLLTQQVSDDGTGTTSGAASAHRIALHSELTKPHYEGYLQEYTTTANTGTVNLHEITVSEGGVYLVTLSGWVNENGITHTGSIYPYIQIADATTVYANTQTIISDSTTNTNEQQTLSATAMFSLSANDKVYLRFGQANTAAAGMKYDYSYGVIKLSN